MVKINIKIYLSFKFPIKKNCIATLKSLFIEIFFQLQFKAMQYMGHVKKNF